MSNRSVRLTDTCLRDGSHAVSHQFTTDQVRSIVAALDEAGVPVIEVGHGDGLAGSSFTYGLSRDPERDLIGAAVATARRARIATLLIPGIGTVEDLRAVADLGVSIIRVATHCTEADVAIQHFGTARELGLETVGFLMMSHSASPDVLAQQARIMLEAGSQCVYVVDSAGALVPPQAFERVTAVRDELAGDAQVGFHAHENLACGVANTLAAIDAGADQIDGSTRRMGAGAGNAPTEALAAVLDKLGVQTGIDVDKIAEAAETVVRPVMSGECCLDQLALTIGYYGVYSSFLKHAIASANTYGVSAAEILRVCSARSLVGGQEDLLGEIAYELASGHSPVPSTAPDNHPLVPNSDQ